MRKIIIICLVVMFSFITKANALLIPADYGGWTNDPLIVNFNTVELAAVDITSAVERYVSSFPSYTSMKSGSYDHHSWEGNDSWSSGYHEYNSLRYSRYGGYSNWGDSDGGGGQSSPVPEPATMLLFGAGLIGLAGITRSKMKK